MPQKSIALKTTEIISRNSGGLKSKICCTTLLLKVLEEIPFLPLLSFRGTRYPMAWQLQRSNLWFHLHTVLSSLYLFLGVPLMRNLVIECRSSSESAKMTHLRIFNLIISAKMIFPQGHILQVQELKHTSLEPSFKQIHLKPSSRFY